jgi:hypothetical protein
MTQQGSIKIFCFFIFYFSGVNEAILTGSQCNPPIRVIPATEISAEDGDDYVHILGYWHWDNVQLMLTHENLQKQLALVRSRSFISPCSCKIRLVDLYEGAL